MGDPEHVPCLTRAQYVQHPALQRSWIVYWLPMVGLPGVDVAVHPYAVGLRPVQLFS